MVDLTLRLGAAAGAALGMALLALCQRPLYAAVARREGRRPELPPDVRARCLRLGAAALLASLLSSVLGEGPSFGFLVWVLTLAASGWAVTFVLSYRPAWLRPIQRAVARGR